MFEACSFALISQEYNDKYAEYFLMKPPPPPPHTAPEQPRNIYLDGYLYVSKLSSEKFNDFVSSIGGIFPTIYHIVE
jgi:hypothetical protein